MEEAAEKMAALKKAYADIILNTAKESAARILASERKALQFQQSLFAAKEEALGTLIRLKTLMDSKTREAEKASLGQVRRIQELELQLSEAEDTIGHLREELKRVSHQLEKRNNTSVEPLNEEYINGHAIGICHESKLCSDSKLCSLIGAGNTSSLDSKNTTSSQKSADGPCCLVENSTQAESLKDLSSENEHATNPDLASIIMRSKEPELYRNGCTQRIRAFERNLLTSKVPSLEQSAEPLSDFKNELIAAGSARTVNLVIQERENTTQAGEIVQSASNCGNGHVVKFFSRLSPRKQRARSNRKLSTNCATSSDQDMKDEVCEVHSSEISGREDNMAESGVNSLVTALSCRSSEDKKISSNVSSNKEIPGLLQCNKTKVCRKNVTRQSYSGCGNEIAQSTPSVTEEDRASLLLSTTDMEDDVTLNGDIVQESELVIPDHNVEENFDSPDGKVDVLPTPLDTKDDETAYELTESPVQAGTDKFLKYTFRRKRKRGSSSSNNESVFPEKIIQKRSSGEKQNDFVEPQKPSLINELPRNNRRLVQVARQLISLSEKRW